MRKWVFLVLFSVASAAAAELETGLRAYEQRDYPTALNALTTAAASDADAQYLLGRMYAAGNGVVQDFIEAYKWYSLAAAGGQRLAPVVRDVLAERMTAEQIAAAQELAKNWRPASPPAADGTDPNSETFIAQVQLNLKRLGYEVGAIDGQLSDQTRQAIAAYQVDHRLPPGKADAELLRHLSSNRGAQPSIRRGTPIDPGAPDAPVQQSDNFRKLL